MLKPSAYCNQPAELSRKTSNSMNFTHRAQAHSQPDFITRQQESQNQMTNAPRFLDKLVNMTAIHDLELMEFSLLKTLEEFIRAPEMSILKLDRNGHPCYQLNFKREKYEIIWEDFVISEKILNAVEIVGKTEQTFTTKFDESHLLTVCYVLRSKSQDVFFAATTKNRLNELDTHMINGLLGIYRNFYQVISESQRDQLTGLSNRKTFDDIINKITLLFTPYHTYISVLVLNPTFCE
ncbi:MAG: hypothetical protein GY702_02940 [Desulfobulbaceae bacterium]|nr:hypothetical protein [Desulfobulbaceae bacterium]